MMGIDQQVNQTADAFRNNPGALQQRYAASQELIDLLALQRLKSEKDAVARQMQMQMQQAPGTVKEQLEQDLLQRNKQELMQQVGETMTRKAAQEQQMAQQAPQMAAEAKQGIESLMQQPKSFSGGGIVELEDLDANQLRIYKDLVGRGVSSEEAFAEAANTDAYGAGPIAGERSLPETVSDMAEATSDWWNKQEVGKGISSMAKSWAGQEEPEAGIATAADPAATTEQPTGQTTPQTTPTAKLGQNEYSPLLPEDEKTGIVPLNTSTSSSTTTRSVPDDALTEYKTAMDEIFSNLPTYEAPDINEVRNKRSSDFDAQFGTISRQDMDEARESAFTKAKKDFEYDSRMGDYDNLMKDMKATYERINNPERRKWQAISAFLRGFAGTTSIGAGFASAGAAMAKQVEYEDQQQIAAIKEFNKVMNDRNASADKILSAASGVASTVYQSMSNERTALASAKSATMNQGEQTATNQANTKYNAEMKQLELQATAARDLLNAELDVAKQTLEESKGARADKLDAIVAAINIYLKSAGLYTGVHDSVAEMRNDLVNKIKNSKNPEEQKTAAAQFANLVMDLAEKSGVFQVNDLLKQFLAEAGLSLDDIKNDTFDVEKALNLDGNANSYVPGAR